MPTRPCSRCPMRRPAKWHLAHTTWFFETFVLRDHVPGYALHDERWPFLFNSYYEAEGQRHARDRRGMLTRPSAGRGARLPRACRRGAASTALPDLARGGARRWSRSAAITRSSIRSCWSPTSSICSRENPLEPALWPAARKVPVAMPRADRLDRAARGGMVEIGHDGDGFAFDCEGPRHRALLDPARDRRPHRHQRRMGRPSSPMAAIAIRAIGWRTAGPG